MRRSTTRAWDELNHRVQFIESRQSIYATSHTSAEQQFRDALEQLRVLRLPVAAIDAIAEAIDATRKVCNERDVQTCDGGYPETLEA